ncbi:MAG: hypothetical protein HY815_14205 [Candidatus Riflebacteria bacterium]|nr:hypothetical protein [Candidatus Riflebacteria bacterium]
MRLIKMVVDAARHARIDVSCCGEIGSTVAGFVLLLGLGIRDFSMNVFAIPHLKQIANQVEVGASQEIATRVLAASTVQEARSVLEAYTRPILTKIGS